VKRGPIVIAGTVAGLIAVLEFHTTPAKLPLAGAATLPATSAGGAGTAGQPAAGPSQSAPATGPNSATGPSSATGPNSAASRTATGQEVNYNFGVLSVRITVASRKITRVSIAHLDDGGNPRSQSIDQQSIPMLEQQALQAQSANIQGVSGASYTSAGFAQSLQSALHSLGMR
jgi:uncharacterized protein with FMN-binding domain